MSKCTALFALVGVLIFFNSVAEGKLVGISSDAASTWSPSGVKFTQSIFSLAPVSIPDDELYTFALTQQPIPEPTTIVILGLGSLFLLRKRKGV